MKARLIFSKKVTKGGYIQEQVVWLLDNPVSGCKHLFKYRLYFGTDSGACLVRYDNERGKGDHKHLSGTEYRYDFVTMEKVFTDFIADIDAALQGKEIQP